MSHQRILPPFAQYACLRVLRELDIECHIADSEADSFAVEVAGLLGAYVLASDSDFVSYIEANRSVLIISRPSCVLPEMGIRVISRLTNSRGRTTLQKMKPQRQTLVFN